jgi:hypothetical protein
MAGEEHQGPGHGDVILSLSTERKDGGMTHRSWTICECSFLLKRLDSLLGPPEHQTIASAEAVRVTAEAALNAPGAVHTGEGFDS